MANKVEIIIEALGAKNVQAAFNGLIESTKRYVTASGRARDELGRFVKQKSLIGDLSNAFGRLRGSVESVKNTIFSLRGALAGTVAVVGLGLVAKNFIDIASANEQYLTTLKTLLGSQEEANRKFKELNDFARETPFQIDDIVKSFIKMKAMGLDPTIDTMRILGDTTSALGGSPEIFEGIARALGQIKTKGKASAEELMQLAEQGVPAYQILKEKLGLTAEQVADIGKQSVDVDKVLQALFEGLGERYGGQMESLASKFKGIWEELKSLYRDFMTMVADEGAFETLKAVLVVVRDRAREAFASGEAEKWAEVMSGKVVNAIEVVAKAMGVLHDIMRGWSMFFDVSQAGLLKLFKLYDKQEYYLMKAERSTRSFLGDDAGATDLTLQIAQKEGGYKGIDDKVREVMRHAEKTARDGSTFVAITKMFSDFKQKLKLGGGNTNITAPDAEAAAFAQLQEMFPGAALAGPSAGGAKAPAKAGAKGGTRGMDIGGKFYSADTNFQGVPAAAAESEEAFHGVEAAAMQASLAIESIPSPKVDTEPLKASLEGIKSALPKNIDVDITGAKANIAEVKRELDALKDKTVTITVERKYSGDEVDGIEKQMADRRARGESRLFK